MEEYLTLGGAGEGEYLVQKSRFIACCAPVSTEEAAQDFIRRRKKKFYDARHNPSAYVLGEGAKKQKSNDDGEPGGTAGNPILETIKKKGITNAAVVVTRYFGGIKLGAGGLIRAYAAAAALALEAAPVLSVTPRQSLLLTLDYSIFSSVQNYLRGKNIDVGEPSYGEGITWEILVPAADTDNIVRQLKDISSGRVSCKLGETKAMSRPL